MDNTNTPISVSAYRCPFCGKVYLQHKRCARHIAKCFIRQYGNPVDKGCFSCMEMCYVQIRDEMRRNHEWYGGMDLEGTVRLENGTEVNVFVPNINCPYHRVRKSAIIQWKRAQKRLKGKVKV